MSNTIYQLKDAAVSNQGGGSDEVLAEFGAPSLTAAQSVAVNICTSLYRGGNLIQKYGGIGQTYYVTLPQANLTMTTAPSGVTY